MKNSIAKALRTVASLTLVLSGIAGFSDDAKVDPLGNRSPSDACNNVYETQTPTQRFLMLVSTMDGYVTALDGQTGNVQWTLAAGSGPLISSSISNLELTRNGVPTRLVPSLDGGLYHMDRDGIEPVPLAADVMLSSSFRFADDSMIIGAKEIESYGINLNSGKIRYICSTDGCKFFEDSSTNSESRDEVLVIRRSDKTVRAVEMQTGHEKWNFSVAQHDVSYVVQASQEGVTKSINGRSTVRDDDSEQCQVETDGSDESSNQFGSSSNSEDENFDPSDVRLKVIVSAGTIFCVSHSRPGLIYWKHEFGTSIASTWQLKNGKLSEVDLFNRQVVPVLGNIDDDFSETDIDDGSEAPVLYVGTFNKQLYIQPSVRFLVDLETATEEAVQKGSIVNINMPRVVWRPYLVTAATRTPAVAGTRPQLQIPIDENGTVEKSEGKSVVRWQDNYPFDGGYYLYPDYSPVKLLGESNQTRAAGGNGFGSALYSWLRLVISILALLMSGVAGGFLVLFRLRRKVSCMTHYLEEIVSSPQTTDTCSPEKDTVTPLPETVVQPLENPLNLQDYISRFASDFQQEACLGRGGFGVVFKAMNRLDDCLYAVKRIALHDSERAREKVMREVKALARLDHPGIVRYYQSWLERPPPGWQEQKDRACLDVSMVTPSQDFAPTEYSCSVQVDRCDAAPISAENLHPIGRKQNYFNPLHPFLLFDKLNDSNNCGGLSSELSSSFYGNEATENLRRRRPKSAVNDGTADDDDSLEISFRDDGVEEREEGEETDWSNTNENCDISKRKGISEDYSDGVEIIFGETSKSRENSSAKSRSLSSGENRSMVKVHSRSSSVPEKPKLLDLQSSGMVSGSGASPASRMQKLYLYIQMQLCQTESLKDWLTNNTEDRDRNRLLDIFHQIVRAISYVHRQGLMHRDLKPSNIFFALDGMVKIGDFGLVTAAEEKCLDEGYASNAALATKHTNQVGTTLYMSPEQSSGGSYTYKVDIYALGMIFFELFFPFQTQMERIRTLTDIRQLRFPAEFINSFSREYEFVLPLLSHDPDSRPSTQEILCDTILVELEEAAEALNRLHSQARQRTMSQSSGNSVGSSSPAATSLFPIATFTP